MNISHCLCSKIVQRTIPANRPDIVLVDHSKNTTYIVDVTIPHDENLQKAERDKILKYMDLAHEIKDLWRTQATIVVPIVISTNGLIPKSLHANLCKVGVDGGLKYLMQKAVLLSTCRTLRGALNGQRLVEFSVGTAARSLAAQGVATATLWLRVEPRIGFVPQARNLTLWAFRVRRLPPGGNTTRLSAQEFDDYTEMAGSLGVRIDSEGGWQGVDITSGVRHWAAEGAPSSLLLLLDCSGCGEAVRLPLPSSRYSHSSQSRPFLVLRASPPIPRRVRRRALDCGPDARNQCCKQRFYVSFRALGWDDWIIAPSGYYANYCRGDCGTNRTPDTFLTYYSHVLDEYKRLDRLAGLRPCCAPLKFSSMSLIYFGPDSTIIKRDLPKMVVDECGCP